MIFDAGYVGALLRVCVSVFVVNQFFTLHNNTCCPASVSSAIAVISFIKKCDSFLLIHDCSCLNSHMCWNYIRGNDEAVAFNLSCFEIHRSQRGSDK